MVSHLLLETGDLRDPGVVRGALRYAGSLADKSRRKLTGNLDLFNVQLMIHPLLQPLRELNGRIKIDDSGIDFQNIRALSSAFPPAPAGAGASATSRSCSSTLPRPILISPI